MKHSIPRNSCHYIYTRFIYSSYLYPIIFSHVILSLYRGGCCRVMMLGNFQCLQFIVGQEPTVLAVGIGGGCFVSPLSYLFSFSFSLEDGSIKTEILSQRALKSNTTGQITHLLKHFIPYLYSILNLSIQVNFNMFRYIYELPCHLLQHVGLYNCLH